MLNLVVLDDVELEGNVSNLQFRSLCLFSSSISLIGSFDFTMIYDYAQTSFKFCKYNLSHDFSEKNAIWDKRSYCSTSIALYNTIRSW